MHSKQVRGIFKWLLWSMGFYLLLELGPFFLAGWVFHKTASSLARPYFAFAAPWAILAPLIWLLRTWEDSGVSLKRLAQGWGISLAIFGVGIAFALYYTIKKFSIGNPEDALVAFIVQLVLSTPIFYFGMYQLALARVSARSARL